MRATAAAVILAAVMCLPPTSWAKNLVGPASLADVPSWAEGDTWRFSTPSGAEVMWTVTAVAKNAYEVSRKGPEGNSTLAIPRNMPVYGGDTVWQAPGNNDNRVMWPLSAKAKWSVQTPANDRGGPWDTAWKVQRVERVEVPAGAFAAVRIKGVQCNVPVQKCASEFMWYAAAAKNVIKVQWAENSYWGKLSGKEVQLVGYTLH